MKFTAATLICGAGTDIINTVIPRMNQPPCGKIGKYQRLVQINCITQGVA